MLGASLVISFLLVVAMSLGYLGRGPGIAAAAVVSLGGAVFMMCGMYFIGVVPCINWLTLLVAAIVRLRRKSKPAVYLMTAVGLTATIYVGTALLHLPAYLKHRAVAAQTPIVDVARLLEYEESAANRSVRSHAEARSLDEQWATLESWLPREVDVIRTAIRDPGERQHWDEREGDRRRRVESLLALARVHSGFVADFAAAPEFGVTRMRSPRLRPQDLPLTEQPPLDLPQSAPDHSTESTLAVEPGNRAPADADLAEPRDHRGGPPERESLAQAHLTGVLDFVNEAGFGYVENRRQVIGFQSHGFRELPPHRVAEDGTRWQVVQLELVSLLKHRPPAAYISKHLPRMEELRDAPTRPLDGFEADALERLRTGEELVVESADDEIRMLGPLRAFEECRQCHQVKADALLGAFAYRLKPASRGGVRVKPQRASTGETL